MAGNARYLQSVSRFVEDTRPAGLPKLVATLRNGRRVTTDLVLTGEEGSWVNSLPVLADALDEAGLQDAWIALEYNPHQAGAARCDAVIIGTNGGKPSLVVVEIKQWSSATWDAVAEQVVDIAAKYKTSAHPYRQAARYAGFITGYTGGFDEVACTTVACAFLHNATETALTSLRSAGDDEAEFTFSGHNRDGRARFTAFLSGTVQGVGAAAIADRFKDAPWRQAPNLLAVAGDLYSNRAKFPLTDEQDAVVRAIYATYQDVRNVNSARNDAIIVVQGAPGSGKTWIAVHLLAMLARSGQQVSYATNSVALREALRAAVRTDQRKTIVEGMITSARTYWDSAKRWDTNAQDMLIVDEAQRVAKYTVRTAQRNATHVQQELEKWNITQLFELKKSARVVVLLMDEGQQATANDFLTVEEAKQVAARLGVDFQRFELTEQHRTGGSKAFEQWVDDLVEGVPATWAGDANFTVDVADSPEDLERRLHAKNSQSARIVAGFCWKWQNWPKNPAPATIDDVPFDIRIGDWNKRWNLRKPIDGYPRDNDWARKAAGADQVGSIFTAQGFEFDYVGVLMGPDLVYRDTDDGRLTTDLSGSHYRDLVSKATSDKTLADRIRNQYRVLLTRGMKGVVLYSTDPRTQALLTTLTAETP